jgi:glycosyltransferase involved in cell wall biosynthesis
MFEYMSAGLPVIASDFPYWREIIEKSKAGVCVDPENPQSIAKAINELSNDPDLMKAMGVFGKSAVANSYNWPVAERVLLNFYSKILSKEILTK